LATDDRVLTLPLPELHRRLEEVDSEAHRPVHLGALPLGGLALEAVVADELPHDDAVLLLDERLRQNSDKGWQEQLCYGSVAALAIV